MSSGFFRLAEFTSEGEKKDRVRKAKPSEAIQTSLADRFGQLQDSENAWKKKVRLCLLSTLFSFVSCVFVGMRCFAWVG